jgi:cyclomaltodextrinase / maltogenic alpha-amylase / neopullulanase
MTLQIQHTPYEPMAYAISADTVRITLRIARNIAKSITVHYGDRYQITVESVCPMRKMGSSGLWDIYLADVTLRTRRLKYTFCIETAEGTLWYGERSLGESEEAAGVFQVPYFCARDLFTAPEWVKNSVAYQIFPERFENGNPKLTPVKAVAWDSKPMPTSQHGGDLPGITNRLNELSALGVNLIYLTPVFQSTSNHKYDTSDYFQIDEQFGTLDDFRHLVQAAHRRGIRVVLDAVFNHTGEQFAPFQDVIKNGIQSRYWNWFFIEGEQVDLKQVNYETFANQIRSMPKLNIANPEVEAFLLDVATYWIRECDIDGWRLDVANEVDHVFWRKFRTAVKAEKSDALIIGEVWHDSLPWLRGDEFDGVMNYLFRENTLDFFVRQTLTQTEFVEKMTELLYHYPQPAVLSMFNLLGSHDTERIWTLADANESAIIGALLFQFLYPGIPMLYYGDEVGMEGGPDPDCRRGMIWEEARQNLRIRDAVQTFAHWKKSEPALWGTGIEISEHDGHLKIRRFVEDASSSEELVALFDSKGRKISIPTEATLLYSLPNRQADHAGRLTYVVYQLAGGN